MRFTAGLQLKKIIFPVKSPGWRNSKLLTLKLLHLVANVLRYNIVINDELLL